MFETIINLGPPSVWRKGVPVDSLIQERGKALQFPGVSNARTIPIKARIDMLATGIRTPIGVKVIGNDLVAVRLSSIVEVDEDAIRLFGRKDVLDQYVMAGAAGLDQYVMAGTTGLEQCIMAGTTASPTGVSRVRTFVPKWRTR